MDKNTIIGLVLIGFVIFGFTWYSGKDAEARMQRQAENVQVHQSAQTQSQAQSQTPTNPSLTPDSSADSHRTQDFGVLTGASRSDSTIGTAPQVLQNDLLSVAFNTKGGVPSEAILKKYKNHRFEGDPNHKEENVVLFKGNDLSINLPLRLKDGRIVNSEDLYFKPIMQGDTTLIMRLEIDSVSYLDLAYTIRKDDYRLQMQISGTNLSHIFLPNMTMQDIQWKQRIPQMEQSWKFENQYTGLYYKFDKGDVKNLSPTSKSKTESFNERLSWIAFKDKYFSSVFISDGGLEQNKLESETVSDENSGYLKELTYSGSFAFNIHPGTVAKFTLFMGPLEYNLLKSYDKGKPADQQLELENLVYLGWTLFRWINIYLIMPLVGFLMKFISNWGILILLLTIIIKMVLYPITHKSYMSSAKMRVLKPQVDAINAKYSGSDQSTMLKRNQETMALYRAAGASPMSGCLPMLLQMPFFIALYSFFPTLINLRGESFLWAKDLSTYDAVLQWNFNIPLIGSHLSLFCLLMTITNIVYSKYTMQQNAGGQQMAGLKWMPYIMAIMFFFMFNQGSSGLCYYYWVSMLITIIQYFAFWKLLNQEKLLAKLEANKSKPKKKSKWMERLEEMQKQQEAMRRQQQKRR